MGGWHGCRPVGNACVWGYCSMRILPHQFLNGICIQGMLNVDAIGYAESSIATDTAFFLRGSPVICECSLSRNIGAVGVRTCK